MKITISGTAASGKSSVAKLLAKKLGYKHYSMGDLQRELAKEHNVDIVTWGEMEAEDDKYDRMIDQKQIDIGKNEDNFVIDSWLGPKFVPDAVKICFDADIEVRAKRRLLHKRKEEKYENLDTVKQEMLKREKINRDRWLKYYKFDYKDKNNFDLIIDSSDISIEEAEDMVESFLQKQKL